MKESTLDNDKYTSIIVVSSFLGHCIRCYSYRESTVHSMLEMWCIFQ